RRVVGGRHRAGPRLRTHPGTDGAPPPVQEPPPRRGTGGGRGPRWSRPRRGGGTGVSAPFFDRAARRTRREVRQIVEPAATAIWRRRVIGSGADVTEASTRRS